MHFNINVKSDKTKVKQCRKDVRKGNYKEIRKRLRPPAGRQYNLSDHSTDPDQLFSSCYLCQMKATLKISAHLHMGNYVNQVHHTINTGESREVKIKISFA